MNYYQKYLKYKIKYLDLKAQLGGSKCTDNFNAIFNIQDGRYDGFKNSGCNIINKMQEYKYFDRHLSKTELSSLENVLKQFNVFLSVAGVNKPEKTKQLDKFLTTFSKDHYINKTKDEMYFLGELYNKIRDMSKEAAITKVFIDNDPNKIFDYMKKNNKTIEEAIYGMP